MFEKLYTKSKNNTLDIAMCKIATLCLDLEEKEKTTQFFERTNIIYFQTFKYFNIIHFKI